MRNFHTGTDDKYFKDRQGGQKDGEPIPDSPLAGLFKDQTVLAVRIVGYNGVDDTSIIVDEDVLLDW